MSKGIENIRLDDDFFKLLRQSLRLTQEFSFSRPGTLVNGKRGRGLMVQSMDFNAD